MEPKDPHSAKNTGERRTGAKVVQLPREWLGPTEDLVPFGVASDAPRHAPVTALAPAATSPSASAAPPSAQSFWTDDAASLHAALQGSPPPEASPQPARSRRVLPHRGRAFFQIRAVATLAFGGIGIALVALVTLAGSTPGSTHHPAAQPTRPAGAGRPASLTSDIGRDAADWRLLARADETNAGDATHRSAASSKRSGAGRQRHPRHRSPLRATPPRAYRSVVSYHQPTAVTAAPSVASQSQTRAVPAVPIERQATSARASNPNPASLLGPGHCACG